MLTQVLMILALHAALHRGSSEIADQPSVRGIFDFLLRQSTRDERAAFIVRTPRGGFTFVSWPASDDANSVQWRGACPRGTVAIAHTHPNWLPMPSRIDIRSAAAAHLPIYVVTRTGISKTDGTSACVVVKGDWRPTFGV